MAPTGQALKGRRPCLAPDHRLPISGVAVDGNATAIRGRGILADSTGWRSVHLSETSKAPGLEVGLRDRIGDASAWSQPCLALGIAPTGTGTAQAPGEAFGHLAKNVVVLLTIWPRILYSFWPRSGPRVPVDVAELHCSFDRETVIQKGRICAPCP